MNELFLKWPATENDHYVGSIKSPIILLEYGDYESPKCARNYLWIKKLLKEFTGELCYVFRHFPLIDIHPHAAIAAMAAEAAATKNKFWEMHDLLMTNSRILTGESIVNLAGELEIDIDSFLLDMDSNDLMDEVCKDIVYAEESGVTSAPTCFLNNKSINSPDYDSVKKEIEGTLDNRVIRQASLF